ncbi:MAG TPA: hypothetical protein PKA53_00110 [Sphingobacterium sp.]|nr:hypothetical protein [Sphingobacterium sp.]
MENLTKEQLLLKLTDRFHPKRKVSVNFSDLAYEFQIEKEPLDHLLNELEMDRKINQFIIRSSDNFILEIL